MRARPEGQVKKNGASSRMKSRGNALRCRCRRGVVNNALRREDQQHFFPPIEISRNLIERERESGGLQAKLTSSPDEG